MGSISLPGSPAPHAMKQSGQQTGAPSNHAALWRKGIPQSPKISVSPAGSVINFVEGFWAKFS